MNVTLTRRAIRAWPRVAHAQRRQTNSMRRKWLLAVQFLGAKWRALPQHPDAAVFAACVLAATAAAWLD